MGEDVFLNKSSMSQIGMTCQFSFPHLSLYYLAQKDIYVPYLALVGILMVQSNTRGTVVVFSISAGMQADTVNLRKS